MKAILFLIVHMKAIYFWKPIAHWFSKKILPRVSGLNCEHDHFVVTLVYDDEQLQAHKVICPVWSSFFNVVIVSERTVRIEELSKVHIKTILSLKVRMKAIYFWKSAWRQLFLKVRWRQFISESPHEGNYFWKSAAGSIYHCLQSNSNMRTRYFQDMPEEGELDGEYEPLDAFLNPLRYSPVCCILFTNIYGSFK